jgi:hypothetical protein
MRWITLSLTLLATLVAVLNISSARAQITVDLNQIRCDQYLAMGPQMSSNFSAWMSGWFSYQTRRTFVDLLVHQQNIQNVKSWCQFHPQESVMNGLNNAIGQQ